MFLIPRMKTWFSRSIAGGLLLTVVFIACQSSGPNGFATDGDSPHVTYSDVDVSAGIVQGITNGRIVAFDPSIATSVSEDIWDGSGDLTWPETSDTLSIVSTDVNDNSAGTGARTVLITGLDSNFDLQTETVSMNGTTPVVTSLEFVRVNQILVTSVGAYGDSNEGIISISHDGNLADQAFIQVGKAISQKSHFTVPDNHFIVFRNVTIGTDSSKIATFEFQVRANTVIPPTAPFFPMVEPVTLAGIAVATEMRILNGRAVAGRSDVWVQGIANAPGGFVSLGIDFLLIDQGNVVGVFASARCEIGC